MLTVDRKEGDFIIVINEENKQVCIHKTLIQKEVKEGDCICFNIDAGLYEIDIENTEKRKIEIKNKFKKLIKNKQGENI